MNSTARCDVLRKIEGHRLGQQEILAILLPAHVLHHRDASSEKQGEEF